MKKLLLILLLSPFCISAQIVNIPDANFKAKLISLGVDLNSDGNVQLTEAAAVTTLDISYSNIASLVGIQAFSNMTELKCDGNNLTSLDLSGMNNIITLWASENASMNVFNVSGCLSLSELKVSQCALTNLNVSGLTNLTLLAANNNQLTSVNVSGCTALGSVQLAYNQLDLLDFSGLEMLGYVYAYYNALTSLNVNGCINLKLLNCSQNQLTTLDLGTTSVKSLVANNNNLQSLTLPLAPMFEMVQLNNNQLTTLDLSNRNFTNTFNGIIVNNNNLQSINLQGTKLILLKANNNQLATIDLSETRSNVIKLDNNPPLQSIFAKNGFDENLSFEGDPNLSLICADVIQLQELLDDDQLLPTTVVSPYCTFVPGGNYNTISGNITFDADNNGCDNTDPDQPYVKLNLTSGNDNYAVFTSPDGTYANFGLTGIFNVSVAIEDASLFTISPPLATIVFANADDNITTQDFCITPNGILNDLETVIVPIAPARPGFDAAYKIIYKNKGNQILSGSVDFTYQENELDFVNASITPDIQSSGALSWNFNNLYPFESRSVTVTLNVNSPMEAPAVNIGDQLNFSVQANPLAGDITPGDNAFSIKQTVIGSFDPNDITCLKGDHVNPTEIGKYLHYNINFENTGTAAAENIVIKDIIDLTKYDISSLQILNASHPVTTRITNDKAEFIFEGINLGASEHGNVTFKIKTKNTLVTGNSVSQKADIYFDYNFPVATNVAMTTFDTLGTDNPVLENDISIYPNPTNGLVNVKANSAINTIELFDVQGRQLLVKNNVETLDVSEYNSGVYFIKINTEKGVKTQRLIKE